MRILLSWLQEYCDLQHTPESIAEILTKAGIEVDHIEPIQCAFQGVIIARIDSVKKLDSGHVVLEVFDGKTMHTVLSKAKNCRLGALVAYAPSGATIASHGAVKSLVIQDILSDGFLCSEKELGLSDHHEGILELEDVAPGQDLASYFQDVALDVTITPNLGHCLSILGIARELAAFTGTHLKKMPWLDSEPFESVPEHSKDVRVTVTDAALCPRYSAVVVDAVAVCPSKPLVRIRLERSGIRSINNIVDATNYVSHELGQPLHAFDAACVADGHIVVRQARPEERLLFLDEQERPLPNSSVVIADGKQALALGGIMGGSASGVSEKTTKIILESASFSASQIRKTSKALGIHTDSSRRFERGTDQNITMQALFLASRLLGSGSVIAKADVGSKKPYRTLSCRLSRASAILGYDVSADEMESAFKRLFFIVSWDGVDTCTVKVPTFRNDLVEEIDLIEEVGRLVGLEGSSHHKPIYATSGLTHSPLFHFTTEVRNRLLAEGLQEVLSCDLISPKMASSVINHPITEERLVRVCNPLSQEQSIMRPSLLPGLLEALARNQAHRRFDFSVFEIGHVHLKRQPADQAGMGYDEPLCFAVMLAGKTAPHHFSEECREVDFYDLKGVLENLFSTLDFEVPQFQKSSISILHPGRQAKIALGSHQVGVMGELHPALLQQFDCTGRAFYVECDLQELIMCGRNERVMKPLPLFPSSERDWTVTLPKTLHFEEILAKIYHARPALLEAVSLKALFEHEKFGKDAHNVTIHFVYRDREKTISQEEVDRAHNELISSVEKYFVAV